MKVVDKLAESLVRKLSGIFKKSWLYLLSRKHYVSIDKLLTELKDLKRAILEKESYDVIVNRIEKIISLIEHEYETTKLFREIVYDFKPRFYDLIYESLRQSIWDAGLITLGLKVNNEVVRIDWIPLKTVSPNLKEVTNKLTGVLTEILDKFKSTLKIPTSHLWREILSEFYSVKLHLTFRSGSLHTVYSLDKLIHGKAGVLYLPHRGMWKFEDVESMFSKIFREDLKTDVLKVLEEIQVHEKVKDLSIVREEEGYRLELLTERESLPLYVFGDGYVSLLRTIFAHVLAGKEAIVLVEELETSLHPGYMAIYSRICLSFIRNFNQQVFLSTHSLELLEYLLMEAEDYNMLDNIKVFRLERENGRNYVREYDGYEALKELEEIKEDLRGV